MKQRAISCLFALCILPFVTKAQHPGFSKLYKYNDDTSKRADGISTLNYNSTENCIFFFLSSINEQNGYYSSEFIKVTLTGNIIARQIKTFDSGVVSFQSMGESYDHKHLYWGGLGGKISPDTLFAYWILTKTDRDLNIVWERQYLTNTMDGSINAIIPIDSNGEIMLLCNAYTPIDNSLGYPPIPSRIQLKKIDADGNILSEYYPGPSYYNIPIDMERMNDGGFLVGGRTFSWGQTNGKPYTLKADLTGNELWHQLYAQESFTTYLLGMDKSKGNIESYYTGGSYINGSNYGVGYINKVDASGTEIWMKKMGLQNIADQFFDVCASNDGGACGGGSIYFPTGDYARGWMTRLDKDGNQIWNHLYTMPHHENLDDYIFKIIALPDGSFIGGGGSWSLDQNNEWTYDAWLIRVDSNGCSTPDCIGDLAVDNIIIPDNGIRIYPNPTAGTFTLEAPFVFPPETAINLTDQLGRVIKKLSSPKGKKKIIYDLEALQPGLYFLKINTADKKITTKIQVIH